MDTKDKGKPVFGDFAEVMGKYNPFVTALSRKTLSAPMNKLKQKNMLQGRILDFGAGKGTDARILKEGSYDTYPYDKYNIQFKDEELLKYRYDTLTCHYVLM